MIAAAVALFAALAGAASAQTPNGTMKFQVPFEFNVGGRTMPAGEYVVRLLGRESNLPAVLIKSGDGRAAQILKMTPVDAKRMRESATLVFRRYGGQHFLAQIWTPAERAGLKVRRSEAERRLEVVSRAEVATVELTAGK
jgi:hypothetical protein